MARTLSFTLAAHELDLTQSAVSRQINALETQLGCQLFIRSTRLMSLSAEGKNYLAQISPALTKIRDASLKVITRESQRIATIALLPTFGTRWLMPRIPNFMKIHPDVTLNFVTNIGKVNFSSQSFDGAIYHGLDNWDDADLTLLMNEQSTPVASPEFISKHVTSLSKDLQNLPKLRMNSRPNEWQDWFELHNLTYTTNSGMSFEQFSLVRRLVLQV